MPRFVNGLIESDNNRINVKFDVAAWHVFESSRY